jgi:hypothetical protein
LKENNMTDMTRNAIARADFGVRLTYSAVMPGFMPGIHVFLSCSKQDVDGRIKSGHDVDGAVQIDDAEFAARLRPICPITGRRCEGDLSHLCEDYGCARKGGLSPHSHENF